MKIISTIHKWCISPTFYWTESCFLRLVRSMSSSLVITRGPAPPPLCHILCRLLEILLNEDHCPPELTASSGGSQVSIQTHLRENYSVEQEHLGWHLIKNGKENWRLLRGGDTPFILESSTMKDTWAEEAAGLLGTCKWYQTLTHVGWVGGGGQTESPQRVQSHQRVTFAKGWRGLNAGGLYSRKISLMRQENALKGRKKEAKKCLLGF